MDRDNRQYLSRRRKITAGYLSGFVAVIGDGVDSFGYVIASIVILYAAAISAKPPHSEHPWGHGRVETIAAKTLSLVIIVAGLQIFIMTLSRIFDINTADAPNPVAMAAAGSSIVGKGLPAIYKHRVSRIADSQMMAADAKNMHNDIFLSVFVLSGVFFTRTFQLTIIDLMAGIGVSIWVVISGYKLFLHTNSELMDS